MGVRLKFLLILFSLVDLLVCSLGFPLVSPLLDCSFANSSDIIGCGFPRAVTKKHKIRTRKTMNKE